MKKNPNRFKKIFQYKEQFKTVEGKKVKVTSGLYGIRDNFFDLFTNDTTQGDIIVTSRGKEVIIDNIPDLHTYLAGINKIHNNTKKFFG